MALPYATQADVQAAAGGEERLRQLSDIDRLNAIDASVVASAVTRADTLINSYAKKRYAIPFDTVPPIITTMSAEIAVYFMRKDRGTLSDSDRDDQVERVKWLRDLSMGVVVPDTEADPAKSEFVVDRNADRPSSKEVSRANTKGYW